MVRTTCVLGHVSTVVLPTSRLTCKHYRYVAKEVSAPTAEVRAHIMHSIRQHCRHHLICDTDSLRKANSAVPTGRASQNAKGIYYSRAYCIR